MVPELEPISMNYSIAQHYLQARRAQRQLAKSYSSVERCTSMRSRCTGRFTGHQKA